MKFVITGHTSGLGKSLYDKFRETNEVIGLSRSTGFDLKNNLEKFIRDDFDVFINNAHEGFQQTELLYRLFEKNKNRTCSIINIGSISSDGNKDTINEYAVQKTALEKACLQLQLIDSECKIILIKPGRLNTPMSSHRKMYPRINTEHIVNTIDWILNQPHQILIKSITVDILHSQRMEEQK